MVMVSAGVGVAVAAVWEPAEAVACGLLGLVTVWLFESFLPLLAIAAITIITAMTPIPMNRFFAHPFIKFLSAYIWLLKYKNGQLI
jgi:hypothetical protein